jgi:hypothetical protein
VNVETPYLRNTLKIWRDAARTLPASADHTEMYRYLSDLPRKSRRRTRVPS